MGSYARTQQRQAHINAQKEARWEKVKRRKLPWWKRLLNAISGGALKLG